MSEPRCFGKYSLITQIDAKIVAKTPLRIGKGREYEVVESDLPIIKNSEKVPVLPGSSLKGFFRANAERLLMTIKPTEEASNLVKRIFGSSEEKESASAIFFHDIPASEFKVENRKHININRETCGVQNLFEVECVMDGAVFEGRLATTRNLSPVYLGILKPIAELSSLGIARLGGFKSRGYGFINITIKKLTFITPGKTTQILRKGERLTPLIAPGDATYVKILDGGKVKLKEIGETTVNATTVQDEPNFLGAKIVVDEETEINDFLSSMANQLKESLIKKEAQGEKA
ncbi:MAG: RAMP superfamily CRISPR-associated protein [Candidatus Freyarchaeota archaeon]